MDFGERIMKANLTYQYVDCPKKNERFHKVEI